MMADQESKTKVKTRQQRRNWNSAIKQLSNWLLAISLAFTGTGAVEMFVFEPRFGLLIAFVILLGGLLTLAVSLSILRYMLDEDENDES